MSHRSTDHPLRPMTSSAPRRVVLGGAPLTSPEVALLERISESPGSRLYTANASFNIEIFDFDWTRRIAVLQDYAFEWLRPELRARVTPASNCRLSTVIVESTFGGVSPSTYATDGVSVLSHVAQRRLLNKAASRRCFRLSHEYLPSTGVVALALALQQGRKSREPTVLVGFSLDASGGYLRSPQMDDEIVFHEGVPPQPREFPRQHFRSDALAIALFSFHHEIVSLRPEVDALTKTWRSFDDDSQRMLDNRPSSTTSAILGKLRGRESHYLITKTMRQLRHFKIPRTPSR